MLVVHDALLLRAGDVVDEPSALALLSAFRLG